MRLLVLSYVMLSFSLVTYGDYKSSIFRGSGVELDDRGNSKESYSVRIEVGEWVTDFFEFVTITTDKKLDDGSLRESTTVRLRSWGIALDSTDRASNSFAVIDEDGNMLGWGHKIEYRSKDAPKIHAILLNYRLSDHPDSDKVSLLLRFVKAEGTLDSTGSIVNRYGRIVSAWSDKTHISKRQRWEHKDHPDRPSSDE